jgi:hypothetical protein
MHKLPLSAAEVEARLQRILSLDAFSAAAAVNNGLIRVDLNSSLTDGMEVKFRSPVDCSQVTGLIIHYPEAENEDASKEFVFADAHGNNVGDIENLFAENVIVKVILDLDNSYENKNIAFVQNPDTNAYLESRFNEIPNKLNKTDPTGTGSLSLNRKDTNTVDYATVVGKDNSVIDNVAFASGDSTEAGWRSHTEGYMTYADNTSHAEGRLSKALGKSSHAEGSETYYKVQYKTSDGKDAVSVNVEPVDIKKDTEFIVKGDLVTNQILNVGDTISLNPLEYISSDSKRIIALETIDGNTKITIESPFYNEFNYSTENNAPPSGLIPAGSELRKTVGSMTGSDAEGAHAEGKTTQALGRFSHSEGNETKSVGNGSHAEGSQTQALGNYSHAEGNETHALKIASHAEGYRTTAYGDFSHAEGVETQANGFVSHAEGRKAEALGDYSHAESYNTKAEGNYSHAEGNKTQAIGNGSHAEGNETQAIGNYSHAEGVGTIVHGGKGRHVQGRYNELDEEGKYAHIVGWGSSATSRKNIHTISDSGEAWFQGDIYVGSTGGKNKDSGSKKLATETYVTSKLGNYATKEYVDSKEIVLPFDTVNGVIKLPKLILTDTVTGDDYFIEMRNGTLVSYPVPASNLDDFEYTDNGNGTYTLTGWKGTANGVTSTEMIIPDDPSIIL